MWVFLSFIFSSSFLSFLSLPLSFLSLVISLLSLCFLKPFFLSAPVSLLTSSIFIFYLLLHFFFPSFSLLYLFSLHSFFFIFVFLSLCLAYSFLFLLFSLSPLSLLSLIIFLLPHSTSISAFIFMVHFPLCQLLTLCVHTFACDGRTQNDAHLIVCYSSFVFHSVNSGTFRGINIPIMVITMVTFYCQCNPRCMAPRNRKHLLFANNDSTAISDTIKRDLLLA